MTDPFARQAVADEALLRALDWPTPDPCAATKTAHRRWARWWLVYAGVTFTTGAVLDVIAYRRHGYPATLTCALRRLAGSEPWARHGYVGQAVLGGFLLWSLIHLVTGRLGPTRGRELL